MVRRGPGGAAGLSEPVPARAARARGPGPSLPGLPETCPPDRCPGLVGPPGGARRLLWPSCLCGLFLQAPHLLSCPRVAGHLLRLQDTRGTWLLRQVFAGSVTCRGWAGESRRGRRLAEATAKGQLPHFPA